ncbi:MAG: hypothetical protein RL693_951, partial [Verrucomicrobiota bacterium]
IKNSKELLSLSSPPHSRAPDRRKCGQWKSSPSPQAFSLKKFLPPFLRTQGTVHASTGGKARIAPACPPSGIAPMPQLDNPRRSRGMTFFIVIGFPLRLRPTCPTLMPRLAGRYSLPPRCHDFALPYKRQLKPKSLSLKWFLWPVSHSIRGRAIGSEGGRLALRMRGIREQRVRGREP